MKLKQIDDSSHPENADLLSVRTGELFAEKRKRICAQTDRLFLWLMVMQWCVGMAIAVFVSPQTWIGQTPHLHLHVKMAVLLGAVISSAPVVMTMLFPGELRTRLIIAVSQGVWTCLLIHLTGGRLETHFHAFGSLAFLALYRDWRVLLIASFVVTTDHVVRGTLWPISVYGVAVDSTYRFIEHAVWLTWINIFLMGSCLRQQKEERRGCRREAELEDTNARIEDRIEERTAELAEANHRLEAEFSKHQETQRQREKAYRDLANASRRAGMAEVATGVLHNVGNVLNSVTVSANMLLSHNRTSRIERVQQASDIISQNESQLASFLTEDQRGRHFPELMRQLASSLDTERITQHDELQVLIQHLDHIHEVVRVQQSFAREKSFAEPVDVCELVEDALKISDFKGCQKNIRIVRDFQDQPSVSVQKHKILLVLINLISNARHALFDADHDEALIKVVVHGDEDDVCIRIEDNGVGVATDDRDRIFTHGFTTKESGHGFGLHSSALAAQAIGGSLSVESDGPGEGAAFILTFPSEKEVLCPT